jgi:trans-aconitate 2-methyltransferase
MRPFLAPLIEASRKIFLSRYTEEIRRAYPACADGKVLLRFPRLFIVAVR